MTVTLYVEREAWEAHARAVAAAHGDVVAVVKGNGYGFGRPALARRALDLGLTRLAVGTVHELDALPPLGTRPVVLTPAGRAAAGAMGHAIATVGSERHVDALVRAGATAPVEVKLASSMRRYGVEPEDLDVVLATLDANRLELVGFSLHLPFGADPDEASTWLTRLPGEIALSVSHLSADHIGRLRDRHPARTIVSRIGTALWHGDKSFLALQADVLGTRPVGAGTRVGYRQVEVGSGTLVMIGAGTAHGVHPLADGRSPFHHERRRLTLVEPPHMHTSMVWVPAGEQPPHVDDEVDVQQPLTFVTVDRVVDR
jgi:alanine racemase